MNTAITATETETTSVAIFADLFFYQNRQETIIMSLLGMAILCKKFCETREMEWYPFFLAEKKSPPKKKKKKASTRSSKHTLFLLNFFVLFWFPFPFPFGFWVPIKFCKTKLCTNLSTKTHIKNKLLKKKQKKKQK